MKHTTLTPATGAARAVLALALAGSCAFAQQTEATPETTAEDAVLAPITVSAHEGIAVPYDRTGVSVSVLDPAELRKEGVLTLSDAVTRVPGVYALPGGGVNQHGNVSDLAIRGVSGGNNILPVVDGIRVYNNSGNCNLTPNLMARMTTFDLGTAEILKGAQGATYGSGAIGAVLFLETPEGKGDPTHSFFNEYGSFDTYTGNFTAQGKVNKLGYFVSATYEHTNNDVDIVGSHAPFPKHTGRYTNMAEAVRLDYDINESAKATVTYRREDAEYQALSSWGDPHYDFRTNLISGKLQTKVTNKLTSSLTAGYFGADYMFGHGTYYQTRNVQMDWRNAYTWNERHTTTASLGWQRSETDSENNGAHYSTGRDLENIYGISAEHLYTPAKGWDNSLALRLDESTLFDELVTARAATSYRFNKERTRVFASVGRGYRAPSSFELNPGTFTSHYGSVYKGNPQLRPQTSRSADIGIEQQIAADHSVSATLFITRTEKAITQRTIGDWWSGYTTFENSSAHQTAQGIELAARGTFERAWETGYELSATYTQPKTSADKPIPYTARRVLGADIHTTPVKGLTTGMGLSLACDRSNYAGATPAKFDDYYTLRWYARYEMNEHLSFHLRVENLTNQKFITNGDAWDPWYLNAGTGVYGGCTLTF